MSEATGNEFDRPSLKATRSRWLVVGAAAVFVFVAMAAWRSPSNLTLEANTIKLYDDKGHLYAMLGKTQAGHGLTLYADDGALYASLGKTKLGHGIALYDAKGDTRMEIDVTRRADPGVPRFTIYDEHGKGRLQLAYERWPRLSVGEQDDPNVELFQNGDSAGVLITDGNDDVLLQASIDDGASRFSVLNRDGSYIWTAPPLQTPPPTEQPRTPTP